MRDLYKDCEVIEEIIEVLRVLKIWIFPRQLKRRFSPNTNPKSQVFHYLYFIHKQPRTQIIWSNFIASQLTKIRSPFSPLFHASSTWTPNVVWQLIYLWLLLWNLHAVLILGSPSYSAYFPSVSFDVSHQFIEENKGM